MDSRDGSGVAGSGVKLGGWDHGIGLLLIQYLFESMDVGTFDGLWVFIVTASVGNPATQTKVAGLFSVALEIISDRFT